MHFKSGIAALALSAGLTSALPEGSKTTRIATSTTTTATPTATVPYKDGSLMCRAGNTNVWDYKQGDKHHYMKLDQVHKLAKSFVCKDLTGKYHDAPKDVKKGESFDRAWVENMDEYKNYVYGLKWKNNEGCQNSTSIFRDPDVCFDKFTSFTEKCDSPKAPTNYTILGGEFTNNCVEINLEAIPIKKKGSKPSTVWAAPPLHTVYSTKIVQPTPA